MLAFVCIDLEQIIPTQMAQTLTQPLGKSYYGTQHRWSL